MAAKKLTPDKYDAKGQAATPRQPWNGVLQQDAIFQKQVRDFILQGGANMTQRPKTINRPKAK